MTIKTNMGNITATKEMLNYLALLAWDAVKQNRLEGYLTIAEDAKALANDIHEALNANGYYNGGLKK